MSIIGRLECIEHRALKLSCLHTIYNSGGNLTLPTSRSYTGGGAIDGSGGEEIGSGVEAAMSLMTYGAACASRRCRCYGLAGTVVPLCAASGISVLGDEPREGTVLGIDVLPEAMTEVLMSLFRTIHNDGGGLPMVKRSGRRLHSFLMHLALGVDPLPSLERI